MRQIIALIDFQPQLYPFHTEFFFQHAARATIKICRLWGKAVIRERFNQQKKKDQQTKGEDDWIGCCTERLECLDGEPEPGP